MLLRFHVGLVLIAAIGLCPVACTAGLAGGTNTHGGRRLALVVGNAAYLNVPLKNSVNDATDVGAALRSLGFQVQMATNTTNRALNQTVSQFVSGIRPGDVAVFFYSGHGVQVDGENYILPVDFSPQSEADVKYDAFSLSRVVDRIEAAGASLNVVIVDACRNNPFRSSKSADGGLAAMNVGRGTFIAFATAPGRTASDNPSGRNSVFTSALLTALKEQPTDLDAVFNRVRNSVAISTNNRQVPWTASSVVGNFSFAGGQSSAEAAMADRKIVAQPPTVRDGNVERQASSDPSIIVSSITANKPAGSPLNMCGSTGDWPTSLHE